ncbi:DegT/DnrJ/EryC1/StrS family aminotransferase [Eudoraea adriatica]|uniref:DegT/DnrJ/EryC1/StrS family aminotransferase n=1 Tax=Eudoraea adriatica TaxID=446681 RepID=UPI000378C7DC|nr:DegT/DnrJ/EryC1/StrS family aminotransferase [Eudoraea adriatica]
MIPFSPPYIDDSIINEVVDSLKSGWITTGPKVKRLEEEVSRYVDIPNVLCINSWTSGAIMILRWLGLEKGDEVIIPAYTYSATALAVIHAGGTPILVDVGEDFNIDIQKIKKTITAKTKAIMPVDFAGYPCDYDELKAIVESADVKSKFNPTSENQKKLGRILILSDAAHSLGALYKGNSVGPQADITIFSFHAVKNITTAEGGAIAINLPQPFDNLELYKDLRMMSLNCQTKDAFSKSKAGGWRYDIVGLGMKINMADVNAAIGLGQIRLYEGLLDRRKAIFNRYVNNFSKLSWAIIPPHRNNNKESSYHIFPIRIKDFGEDKRDKMIELITEKGVAVNVHFIPLPLLSYFKGLGHEIDEYPVAYQNFIHEISLPIYPQLTDDEVDIVSKAVIASYNQIIKNNG